MALPAKQIPTIINNRVSSPPMYGRRWLHIRKASRGRRMAANPTPLRLRPIIHRPPTKGTTTKELRRRRTAPMAWPRRWGSMTIGGDGSGTVRKKKDRHAYHNIQSSGELAGLQRTSARRRSTNPVPEPGRPKSCSASLHWRADYARNVTVSCASQCPIHAGPTDVFNAACVSRWRHIHPRNGRPGTSP